MNRIEQYFPDDQPTHGYECEYDACRNCGPQPIEHLVAMPLAALIQRDQAMHTAGRRQEGEICQALLKGLRRTNQERVEAAYQQGKADMASLWLAAMALVAGCTLVIKWLGN